MSADSLSLSPPGSPGSPETARATSPREASSSMLEYSTLEEVEEQLTLVTAAIDHMCAIAKEQLHISAVEVRNLRKAFKYMVDEGERLAGPTWPAPLTHGKTSTSSRTDTPPTSVVERCHALALAANDHLVVLETYVESRLSSHSYAEEHCRPHFSLDSLLHTPLERRLQTLCVSLFTFFTGIPGSLVVTIIMLWMSSITAVLMLMYLAYILVIGRPKFPLNKWKWVMRYRIWKYYSDYFPVRLIIPPGIRGQFDATKNYMFCYHPHGVHTFGAIMNFGLDANGCSHMLPGICTHVQSLKINYMVPFWHFLLRFMGVGDASGPSIRGTLRSGPGESVVIVVGGAEEALLSRPRTNDLVLNKRKGFIKIALQEGSPLVPVYAFGETSVYKVAKAGEYRYVRAFMRIVKRFTGIAPPLIIGRGFFCFGFGLLPHRHPIVVVMGAPIEVETIASPTQEEIDFWHTKYVDALQELYNKYRGIYDLDSSPLRIVK